MELFSIRIQRTFQLVSTSEDELRGCMNSLIVRYSYFKLFFDYGFGHNHMWVKASGSLERLILVEF